MIDSICRNARRWLFLGTLAISGCASTVTPEEFLAYRKSTASTIDSLKDQNAAAKKREADTNARYDMLFKRLEDISARLSVSSVDNYASALEEQATQDARQYAKLARTVLAMQKKGWELGDTTARELAQLRADTKSTDNSLAVKISDLKVLFEDAKKAYETFKSDDYKAFKDKSVQESSEHQKKIEEYEASLKNLARAIRLLEKHSDPAKPVEETGEDATEFACAELRRQIAGIKTIPMAPIAGFATRQDIESILTTEKAELVERVLGNMALGNLDLGEKIEMYSKAIEILSKDASQNERLYGSRARSGMLSSRDGLIILKIKSLVDEKQATVIDFVDKYAQLPRISKQQGDSRVLLDLFGSQGKKATDLGEVLLTFAEGKLATVQVAPDGTYAALLQEQEKYRQLVPTQNNEVDALNLRLFERDKKAYLNEKEALKRSYTDQQLQQQADVLRRKYAHLFEERK